MIRIYASVAGLLLIAGTHWYAYQHGRKTERMVTAQSTSIAYAQRDELNRKLSERDRQLAEANERAKDVRAETITKTEVIYRDRIKTVTVRDCVSNSGLFELYNSTLGTDAGKR